MCAPGNSGKLNSPLSSVTFMRAFVTRIVACLAPLVFTPVWGFLIAEGYLDFGGGCKDIILLIPWVLWSLVYSVCFILLWIKKYPPAELIAYSAAVATGVLALLAIAAAGFALFKNLKTY
jgi:hypothetical protein